MSFPGLPGPLPTEAVRRSVEACLQDGSWARYDPERTERVENRLCRYLDTRHALLVQSGTLAVELGLQALGVKPGGLVALPAYDYPGNFHSVHALGAKPLLVDVRGDSPQMCAQRLEMALQGARREGATVQAVLVSHLYGGMADVVQIGKICRENQVPWLEDACQCFGATYNGKRLGTFANIGVYSFGGGKPISVGRGGLLVSDDATFRQRAWLKVSRGSALATPSPLQLAALEPQLDEHDARMADRNYQVAQIQGFLGKSGQPQLINSPENSTETSPDAYKPVFYRIPVWLSTGMEPSGVIRKGKAGGFPPLGEGFRALHLGRSTHRWKAYGALDQSEGAQKRLILIDPECFRVWSIGEVGARLQAVFPEKIGE